MAEQGKNGIAWTTTTTSWIKGCSRRSQACTQCYAEKIAGRFSGPGQPFEGLVTKTIHGPVWNGKIIFMREKLLEALRWKKPRLVFTNSMSDMFHENVLVENLAEMFGVMAAARAHVFQVLTKCPERMNKLLNSEEFIESVKNEFVKHSDHVFAWPLPNVWLGVSAEDQKTANYRVPILLNTPAAVHWISAEPLIGKLDLNAIDLKGVTTSNKIGWVVVGGCSGNKDAIPMHPDWARLLRDQCKAAAISFFFKQYGEYIVLEDGERSCRVCGCTMHHACDDGCWWVARDLCSSCVGKEIPKGDRPVKYAFFGNKRAGRLLDNIEHSEYPPNHIRS